MSTVENNVFQQLGLTRTATTNDSSDRLGQDQFLELMITQLNNQDPMKPMENGEFLGQLAQFSTVTGLQDLQNSFNQLSQSLVSNQALQASTLVGKHVMVPSEQVAFDGTAVQGAVDLPASVSELAVGIYSPSGQLVQRIDLGQQASGLVNFSWDGSAASGATAPKGNYLIRAEARIAGQVEAVETLTVAKVDSVSVGRSGEEIALNLLGLGTVDFSNVRQIMQ